MRRVISRPQTTLLLRLTGFQLTNSLALLIAVALEEREMAALMGAKSPIELACALSVRSSPGRNREMQGRCRGDMGRYGKVWGDMGRYGEMYYLR